MFKHISVEAARQLIRERAPIILDVRDAHAYSDVRIPNAIHVTVSTINSAVRQIKRNAPLLIYCYRGHASQDFAEMFSDLGFQEVYSLQGGFHAWHNSDAEIERPAARPAVVNASPISEWLLDLGGDPDNLNAPLPDGCPPLIKACQQGRDDVAESLLEAGAELGCVDAFGNDALWAACYSGSLRAIGVLLNAGIELDRQNPAGATALIYAASAGKSEVVEFLLEAGANPHIRTQDDFTALELAANVDTLKILKRATRSAA
jgi:thiosulfate/3-mercaptopyruvate sulfurtransferase